MSLSLSQINSFHRNGYLVARQILRTEDLDLLISDFSRLIDEIAEQLYQEGAIQSLFEKEPFERRIASITAATGKSIQSQVSFPVNLRRPLFNFLHSDRLLDIIESLVGPEIYSNPTHHVRPKLPESAGMDDWVQQSPVHQDAAVLMPEADDTLVITSWVPLVDATETNGTLCIYPRLHTGPVRRHVKCPYGWTISEDERPAGEPVIVPAQKGDVILIHGRTPHGSVPNWSDHVRWSLDLRWHDARKPGGRPLPGMLVRSTDQPITCYEDWIQAWQDAQADPTPRKMYRWI